MLKGFGIFLILLSGAATALVTLRAEQKKLTMAEGWIRLLSFVRTRIDCFMLPLDQILLATDRETLATIGCCNDTPTQTALRTAADTVQDEKTRALLIEWLNETGSIHWEDQVKHCDFYLQRLRERQNELSLALPARTRLCLTLPLCLSLEIAILLW